MTSPASNKSAAKTHCFDYLDRNAKAIASLNDSIFYFAELGMQEFETVEADDDPCSKMAASRSSAASRAFRPASALRFGSGHPVLAMHTEYDSNPDNSQSLRHRRADSLSSTERPVIAKAITSTARC